MKFPNSNRFKKVSDMGVADPNKVLQQKRGTLESIVEDAPEGIEHILQSIARDPLTPASWIAGEAGKLSLEMATELLARIKGLNDSIQHSRAFSGQARGNLHNMLQEVSKSLQQRARE
jgi:hypothetical protein